MPEARHLAVLALVLLAPAGCVFDGWTTDSEPQQRQPVRVDTAGLDVYLETLRRLSTDDEVEQADVYHESVTAYEAAPTTTNRLRLALVLGTSGHAYSNPEEAQSMLRSLLAAPETLLPVERNLAQIHLYAVEQRLVLEAENRRFYSTAQRDARTRAAAADRRLRAAREEIEQLRAALAEAEAKLDAVSSIEQSIEQAGNSE